MSEGKALISDCGMYRYYLTRPPEDAFTDRGTALFVMLNPSTADAQLDDPTIRRCKGFAKTWGCNGVTIANLYALRATNPKELWSAVDPVGPDNDMWLRSMLGEYETVVCAWGANAKQDRVDWFVKQLNPLNTLMCLGVTKSGAPKHPLYIKNSQPLIPWPNKKPVDHDD